jgi:hypothetical protein
VWNLEPSILPHSGALFKILQTKRSDIAFCNTKIDQYKYHMQKLGDAALSSGIKRPGSAADY